MKLGNRLSFFLIKRGANGSQRKKVRVCIAPRIKEAAIRYTACGFKGRL